LRSGLPQRYQDILALVRLHLLAGQSVARLRIDGIESNYVLGFPARKLEPEISALIPSRWQILARELVGEPFIGDRP